MQFSSKRNRIDIDDVMDVFKVFIPIIACIISFVFLSWIVFSPTMITATVIIGENDVYHDAVINKDDIRATSIQFEHDGLIISHTGSYKVRYDPK
jgi:hypothetical protein